MGALLVMPRGKYVFGELPILDVVDGQQRLTTFTLALIALRNLASDGPNTHAAELLRSYLINSEGPDVREKIERYKIYPTLADRAIYFDLIDLGRDAFRAKNPGWYRKNGAIEAFAPRLVKACEFFRAEARDYITTDGVSEQEKLRALCEALLEDFKVIVITLDEQEDDAQVIFETLNTGGKELAAMDLVRNDVFHRALRLGEDPEALMENRWKTFERDPFWKDLSTRGRIKKPRIDFYLSDMLAAETGNEVLLTELYAYYKRFVADQGFVSVDQELKVLLRYTETFQALLAPSGNGALELLGRALATLDVTTAYPLVFVVAASDAADDEKGAMYKLISSYIVRRLVCGLTGKRYNLTFPQVATRLRTEGVSSSTASTAFRELTSETSRFPDDAEFTRAILERPLYTAIAQRRLQYILAQIEQASRTPFQEPTAIPAGLTIEHVLPQDWAEHWPLPDGSKASADLRSGMSQEQLEAIEQRGIIKHTLGNLTLLTHSLNPSVSNSGFSAKREHLRSQSLLRLNQEIAEQTFWNEGAILARGEQLASRAIRLWPGIAV